MRKPTLLLVQAATGLALLVLASAPPPALAGGKGSDIGGPPRDASRSEHRFGVDPEALSDEEKQARLDVITKEYEQLRRNQDIPQVRARRNRVMFAGQMRYQPACKFLKKVFDNDRDLRTRVAALVAIGQSNDLDTIKYGVKKSLGAVKKQPVFAASIPRMFNEVRDPEAGKWLLTKLKVKDPDVLASLIEAVGLTGEPEALPHLEKILDNWKQVEVQFEALRAWGRCGGAKSVSKLLGKIGNEEWRIRMAAAEGLRYAGEPRALYELDRLIIDGEEPIVIETATEAAGEIGTRDAIPLLIQCLKVGQLRARNKARNYLKGLALELFRQKKDYFTDPNAWDAWWRKVKKLPEGTAPQDYGIKAKGSETISYYKFKIHSDRVLFILDISGSMKWPDAPRGSGIKASDWNQRRIDLAHKELFRTLRQLREETLFNVATFAGVVTAWKQDEVPATAENIEASVNWVKKQLPRGGTATYDALEFGVLGTKVDTIYFLSDGVPSLGKFEEPETILSELRKINRFRRVSINTVALIVGKTPIEKALKYENPDEMAEFMSRIAEENYGNFADESRP